MLLLSDCDLCTNPPKFKCDKCNGECEEKPFVVVSGVAAKVGAALSKRIWIGSGEDAFFSDLS